MTELYGSEQRLAGPLISPCYLYADRFAIVLGDDTNDPNTTEELIVRGGILPRKYCGMNYDGFITLIYNRDTVDFTTDQLHDILIEIRMCGREIHRLVIETYGQRSIDMPIGIWFMYKKMKYLNPEEFEWIKLNSMESGILPYKKVSEKDEEWKFTEDMKRQWGAVFLQCCRRCPDCECIECSPGVENKFRVSTSRILTGSTKDKLCCDHLTDLVLTDYVVNGWHSDVKKYKIKNKYGNNALLFQNIIIEYTLTCGTIEYWVYYDKTHCKYNEWIKVEYLKDGIYEVDVDGYEVVVTPPEWYTVYEGFSEEA